MCFANIESAQLPRLLNCPDTAAGSITWSLRFHHFQQNQSRTDWGAPISSCFLQRYSDASARVTGKYLQNTKPGCKSQAPRQPAWYIYMQSPCMQKWDCLFSLKLAEPPMSRHSHVVLQTHASCRLQCGMITPHALTTLSQCQKFRCKHVTKGTYTLVDTGVRTGR
jgi:hypothetical protein